MKSIEEFVAERTDEQSDMEKDLYPEVSEALQVYPATNWYADLLAEVTRLYIDTYHRQGGAGRPPGVEGFIRDVRDTLEKTEDPTAVTADRISVWLATAILNAATQEATADNEEFLLMQWVTMRDVDVREAHKDLEGQRRPPGEPYTVGGVELRYPGDPTAPIELWINCRCTLAPVAESANFNLEGVTMTTTEPEREELVDAPVGPLQWHGVLAPEGVWSGDGRRFAENALRFRDLPLPLTWQKTTDQGHDGSVVVAKIETIERVDGMMRATGTFLATPEADEVVGLIAEFGKFGVSVDADDAEFEFNEEDGKVTFTSARIASASVVSIPAFAEAFVALGPWAEEGMESEGDVCDDESPAYDEAACREKQDQQSYQQMWGTHTHAITYPAPGNHTHTINWFGDGTPPVTLNTSTYRDVSTEERKRDAKAGRAMPDGSYPIDNCQDLRNAIQAIGRAKDPDAVKRHIRKRKSALGCSDVDLPESWSTERFDRGPGWITHPIATKRIHDYWTKPGKEGYAKIGWGKGGDFNRCKTLVGEEIAENSPEDMVYLNEICARWHHDALGIWPGEHIAAADSLPFEAEKVGGPSVTLTASAETIKAPASWFTDPGLNGPTHLTVTEEGRVFGHLAEWSACHIGYEGVCVSPPQSQSDYAYYATGRVLLDDGTVARTGVISLGGGHAADGLRWRQAVAHYDSTSTAVADVCVGEDDHGIWCAGWIRPGTTDEQIVAFRASDVSGDWRDIFGTGELEMVAALACNVGGFPTVSVGVTNGLQVSLVAAGAVQPKEEDGKKPDAEFWADIIAQAGVIMSDRQERLRALRQRVQERD